MFVLLSTYLKRIVRQKVILLVVALLILFYLARMLGDLILVGYKDVSPIMAEKLQVAEVEHMGFVIDGAYASPLQLCVATLADPYFMWLLLPLLVLGIWQSDAEQGIGHLISLKGYSEVKQVALQLFAGIIVCFVVYFILAVVLYIAARVLSTSQGDWQYLAIQKLLGVPEVDQLHYVDPRQFVLLAVAFLASLPCMSLGLMLTRLPFPKAGLASWQIYLAEYVLIYFAKNYLPRYHLYNNADVAASSFEIMARLSVIYLVSGLVFFALAILFISWGARHGKA